MAVPNNVKTTWICPDCSAANLQNSKAKVNDTNVNNLNASNILSAPKIVNLNNYHYKLILSPTGWLNDDIVLEVQENLKKIDPTVQGLQDLVIGPAQQFRRVHKILLCSFYIQARTIGYA